MREIEWYYWVFAGVALIGWIWDIRAEVKFRRKMKKISEELFKYKKN